MTSKSNPHNEKSTSTFFSFTGNTGKQFFPDEKSNSLGNVQVVISDKKVGVDNTGDGWVDFYRADVRSAGDYYPFGSPMPDRSFYSTDYRFGFNGMEKVEEIASTGNHYTTEFRELDPRLGGRWWSPDIVVKPWESPYAGFSNNPIYFSDPSGLDPIDDKKPQGNIENTTGTWETKNPDGSYTGQPAEPIALKGIEISASKDPTPAPSKSSSTISTTTSSNTYDGQKVANFSLSQNEKYMYGRYRKVTPDVRPIPKDPIQGKSYFDCTGWVGYVCMQLYPDLAKALNLGPASNIYTYALKHGGIRKGNPKIGDMALWDTHAEFIVDTQGESFTTHGASGAIGNQVPTSRYKTRQGTYGIKTFKNTNDPLIKSFGSTTFYGIWTPEIPQPIIKIEKAKK